MLRYRRYRVFLVFAVIVLFALYQLNFGTQEWDTGKYSTEYLRQQLGLNKDGSGKDNGRADQKPLELDVPAREKEEGTLTLPAIDKLEKPTQKLPADRVGIQEGATTEVVEKGKAGTWDDTGIPARVVPHGLEPLTEIPYEFGQGRLAADPLPPGMEAIHWEKPEKEHFPVESTIQLPSGAPIPLPKVQYDFKEKASELGKRDDKKLAMIKEAFTHSWEGYKKYAWREDEIRPVSGEPRSSFNSWGATLVDALDSLWIMGMEDEFTAAVKEVEKIDFTTSPRDDIPIFETTIRYLGGLVAAYDVSGHKYPGLLGKATQLAEVLMNAFDTPNRLPMSFFHWKPAYASQPHRAPQNVVMSEIGSLSMEFTRLSQLTKEPKYYDAIARITNAFEEWQNKTRVPGMWPVSVDASGCERVQYKSPTKQVNGGSSVTAIDTFGNELGKGDEQKSEDGPKMVPLELPEPLKFTTTGEGTGERRPNPDGMGIPAQVENSRIKDPSESKEDGKPNPAGLGMPAQVENARIKDPSETKEVGRKPNLIGMAIPAQVEKSRIKDPSEIDEKEIPPGFVPLKVPEPFEFNSGKVGEIQEVDVKAGDKGIPSNAQLQTPQAGPVGRIQYVEIGKDGKEHPRADPKGYAPDPSEADPIAKVRYADAGKDSKEYARWEDASMPSAANTAHKEERAEVPRGAKSIFDEEDDESMEKNLTLTSDLKKRMVKREALPFNPISDDVATVPKPKDGTSPAGTHMAKQDDEVCNPIGLASVSKYGREEYSLGAEADSTYEYLLKEYILLDGLNDQYKTMYEGAVDAAMKTVIFRPMLPDNRDILLSGKNMVHVYPEESGKETFYQLHAITSHLTCFVGGMFGLGAKILNREQDLEIAKKLTEGCVWAYESMPANIMPESYTVVACEDRSSCKWNGTAYDEALDPNADSRIRVYQNQLSKWQSQLGGGNPFMADLPSPAPKVAQSSAAEEEDGAAHLKAKRQLDVAAPPNLHHKVKAPTTASSQNATPTSYEPKKPPNHEEYVADRIKNERLPQGFVSLSDRRYLLRPEAIESVWYMHRITGDPHWREVGWRMFQAVERHTRAEFAHASIDDVTEETPVHRDEMESFWLAETLKYYYLLFEDESVVSLDEWVLNTEAHPFRRSVIEIKSGG